MRARSAACGAGAVAALLLAGCGDGSRVASSPELLPDLDQAPPRAVSVVRQAGRERLVFLSAVENIGAGPLVVAGRRESPAHADMSAWQVVRRADGSRANYALRAPLRFVVSETHRHWHLLGFERYDLRNPAGRILGRDRKTGFCLGDRYDARASVRVPGEPVRAVWTQECGRGQPRRLRILEGLSPGFGDDYVPLLEGQYVDVTGLPSGRYVLVHRVNADRDLRESDYSNNAASALLELHRKADGRATVDIVASCANSARCA
jgi:Lysyl oxidase